MSDVAGNTYVVTGANSGIGLEAARKLADAGGHVVLAVRDVAKGEAAAASITGSGSTEVAELDLADLSSGLHNGPQIDLDDLDLERGYSPTKAYHHSKLANLLFTSELQRRLTAAGSPVVAHACHPGYSATNLQSHHANPLMSKLMWIGNKVIATSAEFGARPTFHAITADLPPDSYIGPSGFQGLRGAPGPNPRSRESRDADVARRLWEISEERTGTTFPL